MYGSYLMKIDYQKLEMNGQYNNFDCKTEPKLRFFKFSDDLSTAPVH